MRAAARRRRPAHRLEHRGRRAGLGAVRRGRAGALLLRALLRRPALAARAARRPGRALRRAAGQLVRARRAGSSPPSRTGRCRPPSSTRRRAGTPARTCWRTGSGPCERPCPPRPTPGASPCPVSRDCSCCPPSTWPDGQAVRLVQGEAGSETSYGDPLAAALAWQQDGAEWIHLVDLDAAFGRGSNHELLADGRGPAGRRGRAERRHPGRRRRWRPRWPPAACGSTWAPPRWRTRTGPPGHRPARRAHRGRAGRPRAPRWRPGAGPRTAATCGSAGAAGPRRLRPLRRHRRHQGRHPARPERRAAARGVRPHQRARGGQRRRLQPGRPGHAAHAGAARRRGRDRRQGAVRAGLHPAARRSTWPGARRVGVHGPTTRPDPSWRGLPALVPGRPRQGRGRRERPGPRHPGHPPLRLRHLGADAGRDGRCGSRPRALATPPSRCSSRRATCSARPSTSRGSAPSWPSSPTPAARTSRSRSWSGRRPRR